MKLSVLILSCASFFSYSHTMLRPTAPRCQRVRPILSVAPLTPAQIELQRLRAERDAAELKAHQARQDAEFWKQQVQRCQKNGCTKVCIAHLKNNCQQAHKEQLEQAKKAFYQQQRLDHRITAPKLKPTAQK